MCHAAADECVGSNRERMKPDGGAGFRSGPGRRVCHRPVEIWAPLSLDNATRGAVSERPVDAMDKGLAPK